MKRIAKFAVALLSPIAFIGLAQAQTTGNYTISGKLDGLGNEMVRLSTTIKGETLKDSVVASNGAFSFKGKIPGNAVFHLQFGKNGYLGIPVDVKENIKITGEVTKLKEAEITGAKQLPVWREWFAGWAAITARAGELYKLSDSLTKADADKSYVTSEFEKLGQRLIDSVEVLVKKYPESPVVPYIIIDRFVNYPNPEKAASTYAALAPAAKKSTYGLALEQYLKVGAKTAVGAKPAFSIPDVNGKAIKLADLKGKVVLVDFWASWCGPCRKENPNLVKAYARYHDKGFEIIGISLDDKKDNWLKAIEADQLTWLHASDLKGWKSDLAVEYGIRSIPMSFLVDASGKIIAKDLRGDALEKTLDRIFK